MDCPNCNKGYNCCYSFPSIEDFKENGCFSHIKLPINENEKIPEEVLLYIFGPFHIDQCKPRHVKNIKLSLNELI
jgi:hypothetical protein